MVESLEVDISETRIVPDRRNLDHSVLGRGFRELPYDLPVGLSVVRHLSTLSPQSTDPRALLGWSLHASVWLGPGIELKMSHGTGRCELWVDGVKVWAGRRGKSSPAT